MDDLISRQAAIDACKHHKTEGLVCKNAAIAMCVDSIKALPSAQPEIIRCKDCKYGMSYESIFVFCHLLKIKVNEEGFCYLGGR